MRRSRNGTVSASHSSCFCRAPLWWQALRSLSLACLSMLESITTDAAYEMISPPEVELARSLRLMLRGAWQASGDCGPTLCRRGREELRGCGKAHQGPRATRSELSARRRPVKAVEARLTNVRTDELDAASYAKAVLVSLTEEREDAVEKWATDLQAQLASRQVDKEAAEAELKKKEEAVQARRDEERQRKEDEARKAEEIRLMGKRPPGSKRTPSRSRSKKKDKKKKKPLSSNYS
eukprot:g7092.t1